jgi:glycosyltransferase involved in cell wall biosynthesis
MQIYVCTFATQAQTGLVETLRDSALTTGGADHVVVFDDQHPLINLLRSKAPDSLQFEWGYWKPYVIDFVLHKAKDGDIVAFVDPSLTFTSSVVQDPADVLLFSTGKSLKTWCTQDCFEAAGLGDDDEAKNRLAIDSKVQIYRKSEVSKAFVKKYVELCSTLEAMDKVGKQPNDVSFKTHEHEQSVLGVVAASFSKDRVTVTGTETKAVAFLPGYNDILQTATPCKFPKTIVVTPTIGSAHLARCIESVQGQTLLGVEHLIVVDGPEFVEAVDKLVEPYLLKKKINVLVLPFNVGAGGWCGHRVYASLPFLLDADYVAYLDEDNTYDKDHLQSMLELVQSKSLDWAYCLRRIVDQDGRFVANDDCESLGGLCHTVMHWSDFLVDTSCYFMSVDVARAASPHWMRRTRQKDGQEADRSVTKFLLTHALFKGDCTRKYSLNYAVGSATTSVSGQFFLEGNQIFRYNFGERPTVYIFHFNAHQTETFLTTMHKTERSYALDEWQMTLLRGLSSKYNLVNGYAMEPLIVPGSVVYVSMCHVHELPMATLRRTDVKKILYTIESPNIRHQQQWDLGFLTQYFDHVLTYWRPMLTQHPGAVFCPQNTHHLDLDNPKDRQLLHGPTRKVGRDVVMVLECRDLGGDYAINGWPLRCLDPLRKHYVASLDNITVFGLGWDRFKDNPHLKIGHTKHRSLDEKSTVDILKNYTFVLIVENTNADGYVSEKIYDAWIAGCIPLYYGNNNDLVGIPEDMYVDLKQFATSADLQKFLNKLTLKKITAMRKHILANREAQLQKVSTTAFAEVFEKVVAQTMGKK